MVAEEIPDELAVSAITIGELTAGVLVADEPDHPGTSAPNAHLRAVARDDYPDLPELEVVRV